jgi:hypothetical protein
LPRFSGLGCEIEACTNDRCLNGGVCVTGPSCQCQPGFAGPFCQERIVSANRNVLFTSSSLSDAAIIGIIVACCVLAASVVVFLIVNYRLRRDAHFTASFNAAEKGRLLGELK